MNGWLVAAHPDASEAAAALVAIGLAMLALIMLATRGAPSTDLTPTAPAAGTPPRRGAPTGIWHAWPIGNRAASAPGRANREATAGRAAPRLGLTVSPPTCPAPRATAATTPIATPAQAGAPAGAGGAAPGQGAAQGAGQVPPWVPTARMLFVKWLVETGRLSDDLDDPAEQGRDSAA